MFVCALQVEELNQRLRDDAAHKTNQILRAQRMRADYPSPYAPPPPVLSPRMLDLASPRGVAIDHALDIEAFAARTDLGTGDALDRFQTAQLIRGPLAFVDPPVTPLASTSAPHAPRSSPRQSPRGRQPTWLPTSPHATVTGGGGGGGSSGSLGCYKGRPDKSSPRETKFSPRSLAADPAASLPHGTASFNDASRQPRGPGKGPGAATQSPWTHTSPFSVAWARSELTTAAVDTATLDAGNSLQAGGFGRRTVRLRSYPLGSVDSPRSRVASPRRQAPRSAPSAVERRVTLGSARGLAEGSRAPDRWVSPRDDRGPMGRPEHPGLS